MKLEVKNFKTLVFDCDGVILDSNKVKTDAFYQAALTYGEVAAGKLVHYHTANGGISRYKKFTYFLESIVEDFSEAALEELLTCYADFVRDGLLSCKIADGLEVLRDKTSNARWLIVSGGDQAELRDVFAHRGIQGWFDGGIFGSPDIKEYILDREIANGNITEPALFLGDSKYDYKAAQSAKIDFVFLSNWTEVENWQAWTKENNITSLPSVCNLD